MLQIGHKATARSAVGMYLTVLITRGVTTRVVTTRTKEARVVTIVTKEVEAVTAKTKADITRTDTTKGITKPRVTKEEVRAEVIKDKAAKEINKATGVTRVIVVTSKVTAVTKGTTANKVRIETATAVDGVDLERESEPVDVNKAIKIRKV